MIVFFLTKINCLCVLRYKKETKPVMKKRKQVKGFQVIVLGHSSGKALLVSFSKKSFFFMFLLSIFIQYIVGFLAVLG